MLHLHSGEERFRFLDLGSRAIRVSTMRHEHSIVSLRLLVICREARCTCRAVQAIEAVGCAAKRGLEFVQGLCLSYIDY